MHGLNVERLEGNCKSSKSVADIVRRSPPGIKRNAKKAKPACAKASAGGGGERGISYTDPLNGRLKTKQKLAIAFFILHLLLQSKLCTVSSNKKAPIKSGTVLFRFAGYQGQLSNVLVEDLKAIVSFISKLSMD